MTIMVGKLTGYIRRMKGRKQIVIPQYLYRYLRILYLFVCPNSGYFRLK